MTCTRRVTTTALASVGLALILAAVSARAETPALEAQKEKQKKIQAETDMLVRRVLTTLRVLEDNRIEGGGQKNMLDEVAGTLSGLSKEQMVRLIAALEAAQKAKGQARTKELRDAQARHEEIVLGLKALLAKFDAVKNLDEAAERLDKLSRDQVDLFLQLAQLLHEVGTPQPRRAALIQQRILQVTSEQVFAVRDVQNVFKQVAALKATLPVEQKARVAKFEARVKDRTLLVTLQQATIGVYPGRVDPIASGKALDARWAAAGEVADLARLLRATPEKLAGLRDARARIEKTIEDQQKLKSDVVAPIDPDEALRDAPAPVIREGRGGARLFQFQRGGGIRGGGLRGRGMQLPEDPALVRSRGLADRQGWLEHDTRLARLGLAPFVEELAGKLVPAEKLMRDAQQAARTQKKPDDVTSPQAKAVEELKKVLAELDKLIVETEKAQSDPLLNLKDALQRIDRLLAEQKQVRDTTTDKKTQPKQVVDLAKKQANLSQQTNEVKEQVPMVPPAATKALERASEAMDKAAKELKVARAPAALPKQNDAIAGLEEAKKLLTEEVQKAEKLRDDIAKLEDADKKLGEAIKQEEKVAADTKAKAKANKAAPKEASKLAKEQAKVTPPTKELAKNLENTAPEAAKKVAEGAKAMESAKAKLDKKELKPAAKKAAAAVEKLKDAQKELAKALAEKKGMEAAAQAAAKPKEIDPAAAAEALAKALDQAKQAQEESAKAQPMNKQDPTAKQDPKEGKAELAKLQKQVAEQAAKVKAPEAKQPAQEAAKALEKGDLPKAMAAQKKALAKLKAAAEKQPGKKGEKAAKGQKGEKAPQPSSAKNADQLAKAQKQLMDATAALQKSQQATAAAQAALAQAQAQAPPAVQPQLKEAGKQLAKAAEKLKQGAPQPANKAQGEAAAELGKALAALQAAQGKGQGEKQGKGQGEKQAKGQGEKEGQGMGEKQGQGKGVAKGKGKGKGKSQEKNEVRGKGDRQPDGQLQNGKSDLRDVRGMAELLNLPPRQRELIRQAMTQKLPPEYAALIQQYYVNIARGRPAAASPVRPKR